MAKQKKSNICFISFITEFGHIFIEIYAFAIICSCVLYILNCIFNETDVSSGCVACTNRKVRASSVIHGYASASRNDKRPPSRMHMQTQAKPPLIPRSLISSKLLT